MCNNEAGYKMWSPVLRLIRALYITLVILVLFEPTADADGAAKHPREFDILCRLARIADRATHINNVSYLDSLAEWNSVETATAWISTLITRTEENASIPVKIENDNFQAELTDAQVIRRTNRKLKTIGAKCKALVDKLKILEAEANVKFEQAKDEAGKVVVSNGGGLEQAQATIVASRYAVDGVNAPARGSVCTAPDGKECNTAKGSLKAGCDLVHDIMCLCAPGADAAAGDRICGVNAGDGGGALRWEANTIAGDLATSSWQRLKENCQKRNEGGEFSAENIEAAIRAFREVLGAQVDAKTTAGEQFNWVLGRLHSGGTCSGASGVNGCVNYADPTDGHSLGKITWLNHLSSAAKRLREAESIAKKANMTIIQAHALITAAETILAENETYITPQNPTPKTENNSRNPVTNTNLAQNSESGATLAIQKGIMIIILLF